MEEFHGIWYQNGAFPLLMWGVVFTACGIFVSLECRTGQSSHSVALRTLQCVACVWEGRGELSMRTLGFVLTPGLIRSFCVKRRVHYLYG